MNLKNSQAKSLGLFLFSLLSCTQSFGFNVAYIEVNSNRLENAGCFIDATNSKPFFSVAAIFAGNINGDNPNNPYIYFNENVESTLHSSQVKNLQNQGIKVLMTILGNHENAGWACMTDETSAQKFANELVTMVNKYNLDGIDIDDEYSNCTTNTYSLIMLAKAIKTHPEFQGKLLTKALFADDNYFQATYKNHKLAEYLDYGWEMTYFNDNFDSRLYTYLQNGMQANQLMIGGWAERTYPDPFKIGQYTTENTLAGAMVYDVTKYSQNYVTQLATGLYGKNANVAVNQNCLARY